MLKNKTILVALLIFLSNSILIRTVLYGQLTAPVILEVNDVYIYGSDPQPNECGFWLDVKETMAVGTVKVKPNPCDSYVDILFPDNNNSDLKIKMINSFGRIVLQQNVSPQTKELRLNISAYSNGIYIIYTSAKNGDFFINKIFIKH